MFKNLLCSLWRHKNKYDTSPHIYGILILALKYRLSVCKVKFKNFDLILTIHNGDLRHITLPWLHTHYYIATVDYLSSPDSHALSYFSSFEFDNSVSWNTFLFSSQPIKTLLR